MRKPIFLLIAFLLTLVSPGAYEQSRGNMKIVLDEGPGTFSIYDITNPAKPVSLLLDKDARTSGLFVLVDDKVYRMERTSAFDQRIEERANGAAYVWSNSSLTITLEFLFTQSTASQVADGVKLRAFVNNSSGRAIKVGIRFLLDTYLGEKFQEHFYLEGGEGVTHERDFASSLPSYWVSGHPSRGTAFQAMVDLSNISQPSQIVFANWKRLEATSWVYQGRKRSFNYLPYSVNDSAVSHWYKPRTLDDGETRSVDLRLVLYTKDNFPSRAELMEEADPYPPIDWSNPDAVLSALREDIEKVNQVLSKLDKTIISREEPNPEVLNSLEDEVEELKARKTRYRDE